MLVIINFNINVEMCLKLNIVKNCLLYKKLKGDFYDFSFMLRCCFKVFEYCYYKSEVKNKFCLIMFYELVCFIDYCIVILYKFLVI